MSEEDAAAKTRKKGPKLWILVKNTAFMVTVLIFIVSLVLLLDAYKFVSIRHGKYVRKKLLTTLQYMDPTLIESHSGMKVLTVDEYDKLQAEAGDVRSQIREANSELQEKYSEVLKVSVEAQGIKKSMEDVQKLIEEAKAEAEKPKEETKAA